MTKKPATKPNKFFKNYQGVQPTVSRRIKWRNRLYNVMQDGSHRRLDSDREVRRELGLSPRQFRKAKREERRNV